MTSGPKLSETSHGPLGINLIRSKASFIILPLALYQWNMALWGAIKWATFVVFWEEVRECWTARPSHCSALNCVCVAHEPRDLESSSPGVIQRVRSRALSMLYEKAKTFSRSLVRLTKLCFKSQINATKRPHRLKLFLLWFWQIHLFGNTSHSARPTIKHYYTCIINALSRPLVYIQIASILWNKNKNKQK